MSFEPADSPKAADQRDGRSSLDGRFHDVDPEDPRDRTDRDRWLTENVPPHHR